MGARRPSASWVLAAAMALSVVASLLATRGATFFNGDEWNMLLLRRTAPGADALLDPNNQHITVLPTLVYKAIFAVVGASTNVVQRGIVALLVCACAGIVAAYLRPLVGAALATCAGVLVLFLGTGWEDLFWGFQMGFLTSLVGGIGSLLVIARGGRRVGAWVLGLLLAGILSSNVGLPMAVAAGVALVLHGRARTLWAVAVPIAVWLAWYATYGRDGPSNVGLTSLLGSPEYLLRSIAVAMSALAGIAAPLITADYPPRGWLVGVVLGFGLIVVVALAVRRRGPAPGLLSCCAAALLYWGTLALNADVARPPEASRYLLPGAVLCLLVLGEALAGLPERLPLRHRRWIPVAGVAALAACLVGNGHYYLEGARGFRDDGAAARAATGAMLLAAPSIPATYAPPLADPAARFLGTISAGPLRAAQRSVGTPADDEAEIRSAPAAARALADAVALGAGVRGITATVASRACASVAPGAAGRVLALPARGFGVRVARGPLALEARRWGSRWVTLGGLPASAGASAFSLPRAPDRARTPWQLRVRSAARAEVCALP